MGFWIGFVIGFVSCLIIAFIIFCVFASKALKDEIEYNDGFE